MFHAGDSRVYLRHAETFLQVTTDDVIAPGSGILTNCLGGEDRPTPVDVHLHTSDTRDSNAVLVCSDGLSDLVDVERLDLPAGISPVDGSAAGLVDGVTCPMAWFPRSVVSRQAGMVSGRFSNSIGVR